MGDTVKTSEQAPKKSFFKGLKAEFKKISWPDKDTLLKQSTAVVIISIILGLIIAALDWCIQFGVDKLLQIG
jgi:preprotein translocase subunit SecE